MSLFVVDTLGDKDLLKRPGSHSSTSLPDIKRALAQAIIRPEESDDDNSDVEDDGDYGGLPPPSHDISPIINNYLLPKIKSAMDLKIEDAVNRVKEIAEAKAINARKSFKKKKQERYKLILSELNEISDTLADEVPKPNVEQEIKKSGIVGIEQKESLPMYSDKKLRDLRRIERLKTKGEGWFNLPATEVTEEVGNHLKILQMRSALDPKHFYKKNDLKVLPKYFQVGTVVPSPLDYFKERDTRKRKANSLVDELLNDDQLLKYTKRKFKETSTQRHKYAHKKAMKKMRKLKNKR